MKVLVCGSRDYHDRETLYFHMDGFAFMKDGIELIIEGEAKGADTLAREWAEAVGIPVMKFPADWKKYGRAAGPIRNKQMLEKGKPDLVIAFPLGEFDDPKHNRGTRDMVKQARAAGIKTIVIEE